MGGGGRGRGGKGRRTAGTRRACTELPHALGDASTLLDIDTKRHYLQELRSCVGPDGACSPARRDRVTVSRRTLRHDSEDGVVAADAGAILLVVLLGVAHLEELGS